MSEPWNKQLSIVIFPEGELRNKVVSELDSWLEARLISPCVWVFPEEIDFSEQPPKVIGHVSALDLEGFVVTEDVTITDILAQREYSLVRVISLISAGDALALTEDLKVLHTKVSSAIYASLPRDPRGDVSDAERRHARTLQINLVMVPTQATSEIKELFAGASTADHVNIIVSGEDRATPWTADSYVRNDEKFPRFVASYIASVGGIWHGIDMGVIDNYEIFKKNNFYVTRLFVNSIMTDGLARRIAADVLEEVASLESSIHSTWHRAIGSTLVVDAERDQYIRMMVEATLDAENKALRFNRAYSSPIAEQSEFGIAKELMRLLKFSATMFINIPREIFTAAKHRFGRELSEALHGESGMQKYKAVEDDFSALDSNFPQTVANIAELKAKAQLEIAAPPSSITEVPKLPRLWSQMRSLVFGVLDGSDYSDILPNKRFVFPRVKDVIQDPNANIELSDTMYALTGIEKLAWENIEDTAQVVNAITQEISQIEQRIDSEKSRQLQIKVFLDWHENNPAPATKVEEPVENDANIDDIKDASKLANHPDIQIAAEENAPVPQVDVPTPEQIEGYEADLANIEALIPELQQQLESLKKEKEKLTDWQKDSQNSYIWKLLEAVNGEIQRAQQQLAAYEQTLAGDAYPSAEDLSTSKKKYRSNLFRLLGAWTTSLLVAVLALFSTNPIGLQIAIAVLILLSIGPSALKKVQSPQRIVGILLVFLVIGLIAFVMGLGPIFSAFMAWLASLWLGWIVISLIFSIIVGFIGSCASYSRSWSEFRRKVYQKTTDLTNIIQGVDTTRNEIKRLTGLYSQLKEFALLLGAVVSQPWKVDSLWHQSQGVTNTDRAYPFSLHIAQPLENESDAVKRIRDDARESLLTIGWRFEVYKQIIAAFAKRQSAANRHLFTIDAIESDSAFGPGSVRDLVLKEIVDNDELLLEIARIKMKELRTKIQDEFLVDNPPSVLEIRDKPLSMMHVDLIEYEEELGIAWNDFLVQTISSDIPTPPMSVDRFHEAARAELVHYEIKSLILAPARLKRDFKFATMLTYERTKSLPQEAVIRLDYVDAQGDDLNAVQALQTPTPTYIGTDDEDSGA